jgi:hypothetical protein
LGVTSAPPNATPVSQNSNPVQQNTTKPVFSDSPGAASPTTTSQAVAQPSSSSTSPHR